RPATRGAPMHLAVSLTADRVVTDDRAFVAWLDSQPSVDRKRRVGTVGYCMSGPITMRAAAALPDRIGAGASFHGGGLVTDKPDSPHLLVPEMKAPYLIAIAESDDQRQPEAQTGLPEASPKTKLPAEITVYPGTIHARGPLAPRVHN